jgi:hypothetical protein
MAVARIDNSCLREGWSTIFISRILLILIQSVQAASKLEGLELKLKHALEGWRARGLTVQEHNNAIV